MEHQSPKESIAPLPQLVQDNDNDQSTIATPTAPAASNNVDQEMTKQLKECITEMKKVDAELEQLKEQIQAVEKRQGELRARIERLEAGAVHGGDDTPASKKKLADLGYHFKDGKLRTIDGDNGFSFTNQKEYEELGEVINNVVYEMLEEAGLERRYLNFRGDRRFYFASPDYEQKDRVLVLIHGSGVVKAGQWARRLIINESLERGTQLEYIKRGLSNDWGVVVLNYNEKCESEERRGCHSADSHGLAEWRHALDAAKYSDVVVVAHSAGGDIVSNAVHRMLRVRDFRVQCVALTDSWFSEGRNVLAVNWNTMRKRLHRNESSVYQMYSGDQTHEGTSAACIDSVFALLEKVNDRTTIDDFHEMLEDSEMIILEKYTEENEKEKVKGANDAQKKNEDNKDESKPKKDFTDQKRTDTEV